MIWCRSANVRIRAGIVGSSVFKLASRRVAIAQPDWLRTNSATPPQRGSHVALPATGRWHDGGSDWYYSLSRSAI